MSVVTITLFILYVASIIGVPGLSVFPSDRMLPVGLAISPVAIGYLFYTLTIKRENRNLLKMIIFIIILGTSFLNMVTYYASPIVIQPNNYLTNHEIRVMTWFFKHKEIDVHNVAIRNPIGRYASAFMGTINASKRVDLDYGRYSNSETIPDHFNYSNTPWLGDNYKNPKYFLLTKFERMIYSTVWESVGRFNEIDFYLLKQDVTIGKYYSNREADIYYIYYLMN